MLVIRLQRIGKKHQPSYRVVVAERRSKLGGPPVEDLGSYSTSAKKASLNGERVKYWLGAGAHPTPTIHNLLVKEGIVNAPKVKIHIRKKEEPAAAAAPEAPSGAPAETSSEAPAV